MRTPNSYVRRATEYDIAPYIPMAARLNAVTEKSPMRNRMNRCDGYRSSRDRVHGLQAAERQALVHGSQLAANPASRLPSLPASIISLPRPLLQIRALHLDRELVIFPIVAIFRR